MSNCSRLVLFDMNNLSIERDEIINWDNEFVDELGYYNQNGNSHFLKTFGVDVINHPEIVITDKKRLISEMLKRFFTGYEIINCENKGRSDCGHPDIIIKNSREEIFVEIKIGQDCLRFSQLKWFCENKDKKNKVLHIFIGLRDKSYYDLSEPVGEDRLLL